MFSLKMLSNSTLRELESKLHNDYLHRSDLKRSGDETKGNIPTVLECYDNFSKVVSELRRRNLEPFLKLNSGKASGDNPWKP